MSESKSIKLGPSEIAQAVARWAQQKLGLSPSDKWACEMQWQLGGDSRFSVQCVFTPPTEEDLAGPANVSRPVPTKETDDAE